MGDRDPSYEHRDGRDRCSYAVRGRRNDVHGEVGGRTRVGLDIDTPLGFIATVGLEGTLLAEKLDLVDELVATVVSVAGVALRVLVGEAGTEALHNGLRGEVLRSRARIGDDLPRRQSSRDSSRNGSSPSR